LKAPMGRWAVVAVVLLSLASFTPSQLVAQERLARLEPVSGAYFGVNLDWDNDSPAAYDERLGRQAAVYVLFLPFPFDDGAAVSFEESMDKIAAQGGMALLTLEPTIPLGDVTVAAAEDLARTLAAQNERGVPVFLRFAHEMNGSWYPWSQQPTSFILAFRLLADAVHRLTSDTAMVWAPSYAGGYPFRGGQYEAKPDSPDFGRLDTNNDGVLTMEDDPYAPYYPGDGAVDWVALSLYHWGNSYPWGDNEVPEPGKFVAQITGTYNGQIGDDSALPDFYADYVEQRGKPLAIAETSALYNTERDGGAGELEIKAAWWSQVFDPAVFEQMPGLKMINWFEWEKPEQEIQGQVIDWTATFDPAIRAAFLEQLDIAPMVFGPNQSST